MLLFEKKDEIKVAEDTDKSSYLEDMSFCNSLSSALHESVPDKDDARIICDDAGISFIWDIVKINGEEVDIDAIIKAEGSPFFVNVIMNGDESIIELRQFMNYGDCNSIIQEVTKGKSLKKSLSEIVTAIYAHVDYATAKAALLKVLGSLGYVQIGETGSEGEEK